AIRLEGQTKAKIKSDVTARKQVNVQKVFLANLSRPEVKASWTSPRILLYLTKALSVVPRDLPLGHPRLKRRLFGWCAASPESGVRPSANQEPNGDFLSEHCEVACSAQ